MHLTSEEALKIFAEKYKNHKEEVEEVPDASINMEFDDLNVVKRRSSNAIPDCSICLNSLLDLETIYISE